MPGGLKCPGCRQAMGRQIAAPIELDLCSGCGGAWFDAGELRAHLAERLSRPRLRLSLGRGGSPSPHACPRCAGQKLRRRTIQAVTVHVCSECRGVFLPAGQVPLIAERLAAKRSFLDSPQWSVIEGVGQLFLEVGSIL